MATIKPGLYQHYKGPFYQVLEVAQHSETEESLVVYRALYGNKSLWARPLSMFTETIEIEGVVKPRFAFCDPQTQVVEVVILDINAGQESGFESAFAYAEKLIQSAEGYISHQLKCCVENSSRYILSVSWGSLESRTNGWQGSESYREWHDSLHNFYSRAPEIEYYQ